MDRNRCRRRHLAAVYDGRKSSVLRIPAGMAIRLIETKRSRQSFGGFITQIWLAGCERKSVEMFAGWRQWACGVKGIIRQLE